jgi:hypothetical protein
MGFCLSCSLGALIGQDRGQQLAPFLTFAIGVVAQLAAEA